MAAVRPIRMRFDFGRLDDDDVLSVDWWRRWVLLDGSRTVLAAAIAAVLFGFLAAVSRSGFTPLTDFQPLFYIYGSLISGNLTLVTVVVSINQLLLGRQLMTPDQLRQQIEGAIDYRQGVEDSARTVAPAEPLGFLQLLLENTRRKAQQLGGLSITEADEEVDEELDNIVEEITENIDEVNRLLRESDPSMFSVLSTTLSTNYAREINRLRRLDRKTDDFPRHLNEWREDLIANLQNMDIARQYFKTIYLQEELAALSKVLLYTGLLSVSAISATLLLFTGPGGTTVGRGVLEYLVPAVVTVGLFPLVLLFTYILRTATVTRRTAAIVPFTTPTQEH